LRALKYQTGNRLRLDGKKNKTMTKVINFANGLDVTQAEWPGLSSLFTILASAVIT
jgi:hypothetical protein